MILRRSLQWARFRGWAHLSERNSENGPAQFQQTGDTKAKGHTLFLCNFLLYNFDGFGMILKWFPKNRASKIICRNDTHQIKSSDLVFLFMHCDLNWEPQLEFVVGRIQTIFVVYIKWKYKMVNTNGNPRCSYFHSDSRRSGDQAAIRAFNKHSPLFDHLREPPLEKLALFN